MLIHNLAKLLLPLTVLTGQVLAVDPTPADKAKWDAVCKQSKIITSSFSDNDILIYDRGRISIL